MFTFVKKIKKMKYFIGLVCFAIFGYVNAQTKEVLFLGNSYTGVNNLPQLIADVALSAGDTLIHDKNTPGGYTLEAHTTNATTLIRFRKAIGILLCCKSRVSVLRFPLVK